MTRLTSTCLSALVALAIVPATVPGQQPTRTPDVHFVPTPMDVVDAMLAVARVTKDDRLYDLGSGDGRIVITAATRFGAAGVGIDLNPKRIRDAEVNARDAGASDLVDFVLGDIFDADLSPATVVTLYLLPDVNRRLLPKLLSELRPGTRIVSHNYGLGDWTPERHRTVDVRGTKHEVYLWVVPAQARPVP